MRSALTEEVEKDQSRSERSSSSQVSRKKLECDSTTISRVLDAVSEGQGIQVRLVVQREGDVVQKMLRRRSA